MSTSASPLPFTDKREAWIVVGKHRVRVPSEFHADLTRFPQAHCYTKTFDALIYCASVGLRVLGAASPVHVISVNRGER